MKEKSVLSGRGQRLLPWLVLAVVLLMNVGSLAVYGRHNIDSDMSSQLVLADLLNEEGRLLTDSWYYGNDLNIISMIHAFRLGLLVFPQDWHAAHVLGVLIMQLAFTASFLFMARGFGLREGGVWAAAAVLAPFSAMYMNLNVYNGNYTAFSTAGFLIAGLLPRLKRRRWLWPLLGAVSVIAGLQGVRMLMLLGAPLFLACAVEGIAALRRSETLREAARSEEARYLAGACVILAGMLAGYLVNSRVFSQMYTFRSFGDTIIGKLDPQNLLYELEFLLGFFGFKLGVSYLSPEGVISLLGLAIAVAVIVFTVAFAAHRERLAPGERVFADASLMGVALGLAVCALSTEVGSSKFSPSYYMIGVQFLIVSSFFLLERMQCAMRGVRTLAMAALCGVFLLEGAGSLKELSASEADYERAAEYLTQNGYTQGYATYWAGNVLTEASDGALETWTFRSYRNGSLYRILQKKEHAARDPQGRVFAIACPDDELPETFEPCLLADFDGMRVYGFESAQAFWDALGEAIERDAFWQPAADMG